MIQFSKFGLRFVPKLRSCQDQGQLKEFVAFYLSLYHWTCAYAVTFAVACIFSERPQSVFVLCLDGGRFTVKANEKGSLPSKSEQLQSVLSLCVLLSVINLLRCNC